MGATRQDRSGVVRRPHRKEKVGARQTVRFTARLLGVPLVLLLSVRATPAQAVRGDAVIRAPAGASEIVVTTTDRLAGAIHSLTWNGREFIDSVDHGRQLQSALNADAGSPIAPETFNPTEAGSRDDGAGPTSTSRLLHLQANDNRLQTTIQMAFWLSPDQLSGGQPAKNTTTLSNHLLTKRVVIGDVGLPQVLRYDVTFSLPVDEAHRHIVFEALTGYMPPEFDTFWRFDPGTRRLMPLADGPGEQADPVVLSTADGRHAMGVYAVPRSAPRRDHASSQPVQWQGPTYGRFRFSAERVVKWNCVYRATSVEPIPAGEYAFTLRIPVGTRSDVEAQLRTLAERFSPPNPESVR